MYKDILSPAEVDETISKQWDFMEALGTGVDRNDPATWDHEQWYPGGPGSGIMGNFGVGQNSAMWHVRGVPKVKQVFADIYGTDELLTSYDGMCMFRPRGQRHRFYKFCFFSNVRRKTVNGDNYR